MSFIQPCFIRKISNELCDKLTELGYKDCWTGGIHTDELKTITYVGNQCWSLTGFEPRNSIDCGTNEELFLAIAALRYDSDYMQWFTNGEKWFKFGGIIQNGFIIDKETYLLYHKATVEEIIEHFNSKDIC